MKLLIIFFDSIENLQKNEKFNEFAQNEEHFFISPEAFVKDKFKSKIKSEVVFTLSEKIHIDEKLLNSKFTLEEEDFYRILVKTNTPSIVDTINSSYEFDIKLKFLRYQVLCHIDDLWDELPILKNTSYYEYQKLKMKEVKPIFIEQLDKHNESMRQLIKNRINNETV